LEGESRPFSRQKVQEDVMNSKNLNIWQRWVAVGLVACLTMALMSVVVGCTRSKSGGLPTAAPKATATISAADVTTSATIVSVETPTSGMPPTLTTVPETTPTPSPIPTDTPPLPGALTHIVQAGETLYSIALHYNVTVDEIMMLNSITDASSLSVGQVLTIRPGKTPSGTPIPGGEIVHTVQRGENLFRIALRYGTTVQAIANRNNIINPSLIRTGQKVIIPVGGETSSPPEGIHVVQPGENLYRIALRYNTTVWAIATANGLSNTHFIYVGQRLRIP
jgi:LysM repeat protein